jgi:hypothetical protein
MELGCWGTCLLGLGNPAIDCPQRGDRGGFFGRVGGFEGDNAGKENEAPAVRGLNGDHDVAAGEDVQAGGAFEAEADGVDGLGRGSECGAGCGTKASAAGVELSGFTAKALVWALELDQAGNARARLMELDTLENQETPTGGGGCSLGVQFCLGSLLTIGVRFQVFSPG